MTVIYCILTKTDPIRAVTADKIKVLGCSSDTLQPLITTESGTTAPSIRKFENLGQVYDYLNSKDLSIELFDIKKLTADGMIIWNYRKGNKTWNLKEQ